MIAVALAIATAIFGVLLWEAKQSEQEFQDQLATTQQQLESERISHQEALEAALENQRLSSAQENLQAFNQIAENQQALDRLYAATIDTLVWGANQASRYRFGELPLGDDRLQLIEQLTDQLDAIEFSGVVQIETHAGDFCQTVSGTSGYVLAENRPASSCDRIGAATGEALENSLGQSVAFANFVQLTEERTNGRIRYEILSRGNSEPLLEYPTLAGVTAEAWNRIAAANNRVVINLRPDAN